MNRTPFSGDLTQGGATVVVGNVGTWLKPSVTGGNSESIDNSSFNGFGSSGSD